MTPAEQPSGRFAAVLAVPAFRCFFIGQTVSQFGDRLVPVALAFTVLRATHSAAGLSLVLVSGALAQLACLLPAGVLAAAAGPAVAAWTFGLDAATFAVSALSLALIGRTVPPARRPALRAAGRPAGRAAWRVDLRAGWAAFRSCRWILITTAVLLLADFAFAIFVVLGPLACLRYYHGAVTWSAVSAAGAAGSVAGGLATARVRPRHPLRWALPAAACFALPALALATRLPVAMVAALSAVGETGLLLFTRLYLTAIQRTFAPDVLSRVSSFGLTGSAAVYPLGLACAAPLASAITVGTALSLAGLVLAASMLSPLLAPSVRSFEQTIE